MPGADDTGPPPVIEPTVIVVEREGDIVRARLAGKLICQKLGFGELAVAKTVTAISELSRNIVKYAARGTITLRSAPGDRIGLEVVASDRGPGILDIEAVLRPGYRSRTGMGAGLRGTRAIMDFFEIRSRPGEGTTVTIRKLKG